MRKRQALPSRSQRGSVLVIALLLMVLLSLLGITILTVATTEHNLAYNGVWSEAALMAAEAGVNRGISLISANTTTSTAVISTTTLAGTSSTYRSGTKTDNPSNPTPPTFVGTRTEAGYSLAVGTGYNPGGYIFYTYQIDATGSGPRSAQRQVEVEAEFGPVPQ